MKVKRTLGAAAFVGSSIVLKDISSRQYLDSRVRVVLERMGKPKNHLVVFLPGMMQDIRKQVDPILGAFESKYDLMYVYPGSELYLLDKVVETVVQQVLVAMEESKYESVLLVSISMTVSRPRRLQSNSTAIRVLRLRLTWCPTVRLSAERVCVHRCVAYYRC